MSEKLLSEHIPAIEETNICLESDIKIVYTTAENVYSEENDQIKEVEEDMELLELKDSVGSDSVLFNFKSKVNSPVPSPRLSTKNRRYTLRPQKRPETTECDKYNTSTSKRKTSSSLPRNGSLETIFENPVMKNGSLTLLGKAKLKRYLAFDTFVSKAKLRHRKLRLKRLGKSKRQKSNYKVSVEDVKLKLKALENGEDDWMDVLE